MQRIQKMGNSRVVPEEEYVPRKHKSRKHQRKQMREDKRSFDYDEDKQAFNRYH